MTAGPFHLRVLVHAVLGAAALLGGVALGRPELVALASPSIVLAALGLATARDPGVEIESTVDPSSVTEGGHADLTLRVSAAVRTRCEIEVVLPPGVEAKDRQAWTLELRPGSTRTLRLPLRAARWGVHRVGPVRFRAASLAGLSTSEGAEAGAELTVVPGRATLHRLLRPRRTRPVLGEHVSRERGGGLEFAELGPFLPGADPRRINWRASARHGGLWVNLRHPERSGDVVLVVDVTSPLVPPAGGPSVAVVQAAATVADLYLRSRDRVGLVGLGGGLEWILPRSGEGQRARIVAALTAARPGAGGSLPGQTRLWRRLIPAGALAVVVTPLLDAGAVTAVAELRAGGIDAAVLSIEAEGFLPPPAGRVAELARRIWRLEREVDRGRLLDHGVAVVGWAPETPLDVAFTEMEVLRRRFVRAR